jgi:hypothetical protein
MKQTDQSEDYSLLEYDTVQSGEFQRNLVPPPSQYPQYSILHAYTVYIYQGYADDDGCGG